MPYHDELVYNDAEDIDGPGDVELPVTAHHMQAKAEVDLLIRAGALNPGEAEVALKRWRAQTALDDSDRVDAAIALLEERGVVDGDEAEDLRSRQAEPA